VPQPVPELAVLTAGAGQDGHEPAAVAGDVVHGGPVGELGVGDVEEVGPADQGPQLVPGGDVGAVVVGVAVLGPKRDRDGPISGHGQDPQQLLQVRPVVLVVSVGDRRGLLAAPGVARGAAVGAGEGDRGRVVVQLGELDVELAHRGQHDTGDQAGPIGVEEPVQHAPHPVVVQGGRVAGGQAE
jgi:hypothetical protein